MHEKREDSKLEALTDQEVEQLWHFPSITKDTRIREQHQRRRMVQRATAAALCWNAAFGSSMI